MLGWGRETRAREIVGGTRQAHCSDIIMRLDREPINTRFRYSVLDVGSIRSGGIQLRLCSESWDMHER